MSPIFSFASNCSFLQVVFGLTLLVVKRRSAIRSVAEKIRRSKQGVSNSSGKGIEMSNLSSKRGKTVSDSVKELSTRGITESVESIDAPMRKMSFKGISESAGSLDLHLSNSSFGGGD